MVSFNNQEKRTSTYRINSQDKLACNCILFSNWKKVATYSDKKNLNLLPFNIYLGLFGKFFKNKKSILLENKVSKRDKLHNLFISQPVPNTDRIQTAFKSFYPSRNL